MYNIIRDLLFKFDSELVHDFSLELIKRNPFNISVKELPLEVDGIRFRNPIGLAAGFDKDGLLIDTISKLGFGFMEVGTITPKPQIGNPKPRLFRDINNKSLINRMGFNNSGLEVIKQRLSNRSGDLVIGANIGKGYDTDLDSAHKDYLESFLGLMDLVSYFTINVSSPNTVDLLKLMEVERLKRIVSTIQEKNTRNKPIYIKVSSKLSDIEGIIRLIEDYKINGIVLNNTKPIGLGGLSGGLITNESLSNLYYVKQLTEKTIIGSGGLMTVEDIKSRLSGGCKLVQIWTGFVWNGPYFVKKCLEEI